MLISVYNNSHNNNNNNNKNNIHKIANMKNQQNHNTGKHIINSNTNYNNKNKNNNNKKLRKTVKTSSQANMLRMQSPHANTANTHKTHNTHHGFVLLPLPLQLPLLLFCMIFFMHLESAQLAGALSNNQTTCTHTTINGTAIKNVGSVWIDAANPCEVYSCVAGLAAENETQALPYVKRTQVECNEFYCEVDSELRAVEGSCCGECVRTRCGYNDKVYEVGQTWHNDVDCTLLECTRLDNGLPMINAYERTCPKLPPDCPRERVYTEKCCQYCRNPAVAAGRQHDDAAEDGAAINDDIWTPEFYSRHPCVRDCKANEPAMTCRYTFVVEWYQTMSKACYDCPRNLTDCNRPHCIAADGLSRSITVVNRMLPGPAIEVCENDIIVADVYNNMLGDSTTMHWHGLHQKDTPYMDGVPHVTQCPISPHASFRYTFKADNVGTHFWHSHTGMQRGDGMSGPLIIRRPKAVDPHGPLYDFDLTEHVMLVTDWMHMPGVDVFSHHYHSRGDNKPRTLLINGRGRFYNLIWEQAKKEARAAQPSTARKATNATMTTTTTTTTTTTAATTTTNATPQIQPPEIELLQTNLDEAARLRFKDNNELPRLARLVKQATRLQPVNASWSSTATPTLERQKRANDAEPPLETLPLQVYTVRRGFRYRFRIINAEFLNCPIVVSIDNHTLTAINSDGYDFEALEVGSIVTYAGERFDFVLNANQPVDNYWIRLKGLMDCSEVFTSAFQVAILRYDGAAMLEPSGELAWRHQTAGIELNVMNRGPGYPDSLTAAELRALPVYDRVPGIDHDTLKPEADYKFFVYYDFYAKDNPVFHPAGLYGFNDTSLTAENRQFTPQLNHISLKFPSVSLLSARDQVDESLFCNDTSLEAQGIDCREQFCRCHHVLQVPLNAVVELIIVDEGFAFYANHPFHLHGNAFRVVGLERLGENVTIEMVKQLDRYNLLKRNLINPPVKDTVTVPDGGYTIIRFEAYNPGYWLFHCHIEFHAEIGMALIFKVGNNDQMPPVPENFPTCNDYMPDPHANAGNSGSTSTSHTFVTHVPPPAGGSATTHTQAKAMSLTLILLLAKYLR